MGAEPSELECRECVDLLADYLDGTLPKAKAELLEWHLEECAPCVAFVNTYRGTIEVTRKISDVPIPPELKHRLLKVLRTRTD